jgi:hypothetical protein
MALFTVIPDIRLQPDAKVLSVDALAFRDNPIAIIEGDATAIAAGHQIKTAALENAAVTPAKMSHPLIISSPPVELLNDSTPAIIYTDITVVPGAGHAPNMALISVLGIAAVTGGGGDLTANVYFRANGDAAWTDALALRMTLKGLTTTDAITSGNAMFLIPLDGTYKFEYKTSIANGAWSYFKIHLLGYI